MKFKVVFEPAEEGGFVVHLPALPGFWSQGDTRDEALSNIREAAIGWLETRQDRMSADAANDFELISI